MKTICHILHCYIRLEEIRLVLKYRLEEIRLVSTRSSEGEVPGGRVGGGRRGGKRGIGGGVGKGGEE